MLKVLQKFLPRTSYVMPERLARASGRPGGTPGRSRTTQPRRQRRISVPLLRLAVLVGLSVVLVPGLLSRRVHAKRAHDDRVSANPSPRLLERERELQALTDGLRAILEIPHPVTVSLAEVNSRVVSVERLEGSPAVFTLSIEAGFIDTLTAIEMSAVVAHELGHVWIFTHHPFLQTEELANEIAMRAVTRESLEAVYTKVWERTGRKGTLVYLPQK
jgi:cell division septation protein DedD